MADHPSNEFPPVLLLYHPSMQELAEKICETCQKQCQDNQLVRKVQLWSKIQWNTFPDGWPNIFIEDVAEIAGRDVILLTSFHSPQVTFEQLSLIYSLPRYVVRSYRIIMPYYPTATMERIDEEGQVVTAKTFSRMISITPLAARGPAQICIYDIHSLQGRFYFSDQVIPRLLTAIPSLIRELKKLPDVDDLAVAFPDEGAFKRFHRSLDQWPVITCTKIREGDKRVVKIKEGNPKGKHVVIVDDLVQTGGTLLQCAEIIKTNGAAKISMFVTHAVFPQDSSWRKFTTADAGIDNFWITNSIPHATNIAKNKPFKLICLSRDIVNSLLADKVLTMAL